MKLHRKDKKLLKNSSEIKKKLSTLQGRRKHSQKSYKKETYP